MLSISLLGKICFLIKKKFKRRCPWKNKMLGYPQPLRAIFPLYDPRQNTQTIYSFENHISTVMAEIKNYSIGSLNKYIKEISKQ